MSNIYSIVGYLAVRHNVDQPRAWSGKRSETSVSESTTWIPQENQSSKASGCFRTGPCLLFASPSVFILF